MQVAAVNLLPPGNLSDSFFTLYDYIPASIIAEAESLLQDVIWALRKITVTNKAIILVFGNIGNDNSFSVMFSDILVLYALDYFKP